MAETVTLQSLDELRCLVADTKHASKGDTVWVRDLASVIEKVSPALIGEFSGIQFRQCDFLPDSIAYIVTSKGMPVVIAKYEDDPTDGSDGDFDTADVFRRQRKRVDV